MHAISFYEKLYVKKNWLLAILTRKRRFLRDQRNDSLLDSLNSHN